MPALTGVTPKRANLLVGVGPSIVVKPSYSKRTCSSMARVYSNS